MTATVNELIEDTTHMPVTKGWTQYFLKGSSEELVTGYPQNMTPLRQAWTTYANIEDGLNMARDAYVELGIAVHNPQWGAATKEERETGKVLEILVVRPDLIGGMDEMPLFLSCSRGEKGKRDKKVLHTNVTIKAELKRQRHTTSVRGKKTRGRQVSDQHNKYGTYCGGSKANGERWADLLIVKAEEFGMCFTHSYAESKDGGASKLTLPDTLVGGRLLPGRVTATPNGGMNAKLF